MSNFKTRLVVSTERSFRGNVPLILKNKTSVSYEDAGDTYTSKPVERRVLCKEFYLDAPSEFHRQLLESPDGMSVAVGGYVLFNIQVISRTWHASSVVVAVAACVSRMDGPAQTKELIDDDFHVFKSGDRPGVVASWWSERGAFLKD